ncbi:uncharacterized isoform X3 [Oryza sativa Japonica Group]|uniref:uncharacterized isoform X3 n=1 Tax=Oryza sativa subsp. japonica TaxID=39947 RepID=UPI00077558CD|nr:uncharacterized protein LOC4323937 isoform X3 [Oryza sativa Japonica Group]KAF2950507.1 hypothetical protein DAI22_01g192800 [Oryza sativa Japonica Group]
MGRRRRFAQLATTSDDDDDDAPAADAPPKAKPPPPPSSSSGPKKPKQRRLSSAAADDDDDVEEDDLELEEEEEDEKDLEEMRRNEEEERREETQTRRRRRRRGRKPKRPAEESEEDEEEEEEEAKAEEAREEENTEAVPIGEPVKITGRGKKQRKHYTSFEYEGNTFELEDPVLLTPEDSKEKPYVAILKDITETEGSLSVTGQWFYRPEEADKKGGGSWKASDTRELFYSFHIDDVPAESVMHKCVVHFIPQHKKIPSRKEHPGFIVQKVYDTVAKKLWNLTDKDYEDNKQHEIDLLVKKTIDRIGQLSDIEPADAPGDNNDQLSNKRGLRKRPVLPIDVSRDDALAGKSEQFGKAETPGSDKLKNYATLVKYKAVTGDQYRDRWLDKLVDTIPLTSKESAGASHADPGGATKSSTNGSSAKEVSSGDNEKSYSPDVIVSIMASLERSTYEALGSDFQKYNQKLRQLLFNIKNSPVLRNRLMNKELDPPVLLTMSPDELKVGLTAAERTSEPEESRKLQMTDARCVRCAEKEVGVSDIIHAGHGDRYQLECNACGHSWFSSRDAITTLTVDTPTSAGGSVGTAPWATAKFDVMEKQLTSPRDHQPDKPLADALHKSAAPYMPTLEKQKSFGKHKPDEPSSAPAAGHE